MVNLNKNYCINGKKFVCKLKEPSLDDLIQSFLEKTTKSESNVAVAVNNQVIAKCDWKKKKICIKDRIEIVAPFFGG